MNLERIKAIARQDLTDLIQLLVDDAPRPTVKALQTLIREHLGFNVGADTIRRALARAYKSET